VWPWKYCGRRIIASGRRFWRPHGRRGKCDLGLSTGTSMVSDKGMRSHKCTFTWMTSTWVDNGKTLLVCGRPGFPASWANGSKRNTIRPTCPSEEGYEAGCPFCMCYVLWKFQNSIASLENPSLAKSSAWDYLCNRDNPAVWTGDVDFMVQALWKWPLPVPYLPCALRTTDNNQQVQAIPIYTFLKLGSSWCC